MNVLELGRAAAMNGCVPGPSRRGFRADGQPRRTYNAAPLTASSWWAGMANAKREARAALGRKTSVGRLLDELYDRAAAWGDLRDRRARSVIGAELGGRCPDSVRRAALAAMKVGELYVDECQGDRARGDGRPWHGKPTNVYVLVRALPLIARMPLAQRTAHLEDPTIQRAIAWVRRQAAGGRVELQTQHQAAEDRASAAIASVPSSAPPPPVREAAAPSAAPVEISGGCPPKPDNLSRTPREIVSSAFYVSDSSPFFPPLRAGDCDRPSQHAGDGAAPSSSGPVGGPPAAETSEVGVTAGASSVPGLEPPALERASPSSTIAAGAYVAAQAHDEEGSVDPPAPCAERRIRREIAAQLLPYLAELERLARAPAPAPRRRAAWTPDDETRGRAELAARLEAGRLAELERDRERFAWHRARIERARELDRIRVEAAATRSAAAAAAARQRELLEALPRLLSPAELLQLREELEAAAAAVSCELPPFELRELARLYPAAAEPWLDVVAARIGGVS